MEERIQPTEEDGYEALRGHLVERALLARERYGPELDLPALRRLLEDRELVRFPVQLRFADEPLMRGEFAHAAPLGQHAACDAELLEYRLAPDLSLAHRAVVGDGAGE